MRKPLVVFVSLLLAGALTASAGWEEGVAAFSKKDFQTAAQEFQTLADQQPESYRIQYMLGLSLQRLGRKEEALNHLRKAYDLNPNDVAVKASLGNAYFAVRRYEEVAKLLDQMDTSSLPASQRAAVFQLRGESKRKLGNMQGAYSEYRQLAQLKPNDAKVQYQYGVTALRADQIQAAINALDTAVRLDPDDSDKKITYANALIRKARGTQNRTAKKTAYIKASELASEVVSADPSFENLMLKLSAELGAGQYSEAVQTGERAAQKNPRDWIVPFYIGQAYTSDQQYQAAIDPLNEALELATSPTDQKRVWKQIGYAHEKLKNYSRSISAYQNAGDQAGVARVQKNEETAKYNEQVEAENERIRQMEEEAKRLEEEMKKLEEGEGGGGF